MSMTTADKRMDMTVEERLRLEALKLAQETLDETASDVVERADKYANFLLKGDA